MTNLPIIEKAKDELTAIFKDLHQNPELGFAEHRTAGIVAEKLKEYGVDEVSYWHRWYRSGRYN